MRARLVNASGQIKEVKVGYPTGGKSEGSVE